MVRSFALLFALVAYLLFFAVFLWLIAFAGDVQFVPTDAPVGVPTAGVPMPG